MIRKRYRDRFDDQGIDEVREYIRLGQFAGEKLKHAQAWIEEKDSDEERKSRLRNETSQSEQTEIARSSVDAAWVAANAAKTANKVAMGSLVVSGVALLISLLAWYR